MFPENKWQTIGVFAGGAALVLLEDSAGVAQDGVTTGVMRGQMLKGVTSGVTVGESGSCSQCLPLLPLALPLAPLVPLPGAVWRGHSIFL